MSRLAAIPALALLAAGTAHGAEWVVAPGGEGPSLAEAVSRAAPGDRLLVRGGTYPGPLVVDRPLILEGEGWPVVDGGGSGTVLALRAPGIVLRGFVIRGSGSSLDQENSGIAAEAPRAVVEGNRLEDVLFGIYLRNSRDTVVRGNRIRGKALPLPRRGDAIRIWYSDGAVVEGNDVVGSRDVVLWYSADLNVRGNRVRQGRYGLHFMYCDDAEIRENLLAENSVGAFLMYSRRLFFIRNAVAGNHGPSGYGVGLKDMDDARVVSNLFAGNRVGAFLDNSPREQSGIAEVRGNLFAGNDFGLLLLPNVRRGQYVGNTFAENREQVGIAGAGELSAGNRFYGNHWSDYAGFDADGDGFGDLPYRAERLFESLSDRRPALRLFRDSPVTHALDFAARAFPLVRPRPKLEDPRPRMAPGPPPPVLLPPRRSRAGLAPAAGGMVAGALLILALPVWLGPGRRAAARFVASRPTGAAVAGAGTGVAAGGVSPGVGGGGDGPGAEPTPPAGAIPEGGVSEAGEARVRQAGAGEEAPGAAAGEAYIRVEDVSKRFGDHRVLDGLSFSVTRGESVALWGPNGAGKTTALRALLGLIRVRGTVRVGGLDPGRRGKAVRRSVGFVPQELAFQGNLPAVATLDLFARLRQTPRGRVDELMEELGLADHAGKAVQTLSGGLKQRLALAVALLADPPLLLLDEPTANLDAAARTGFLQLLVRLKAEGKTLVFSSHRWDEVMGFADRILRLEAGRVVEGGGPVAAGDVLLRLQPAPGAVERAGEILAAGGFPHRREGGLLELKVAAGRKVEPLALVLGRGVELLDFSVEGGAEVHGVALPGDREDGDGAA